MIFYEDHEPAHVHVRKAGREVKIAIGRPSTDEAPGEAPSIVKVKRMGRENVRRAWNIVAEHQAFLLAEWKRLIT